MKKTPGWKLHIRTSDARLVSESFAGVRTPKAALEMLVGKYGHTFKLKGLEWLGPDSSTHNPRQAPAKADWNREYRECLNSRKPSEKYHWDLIVEHWD